ncbi:hypothetical protein E2542_SST25575 [Spatholobus suberectus]|nr:hypothetical protein E2542_SST25575 [Spatholobus suberectus]
MQGKSKANIRKVWIGSVFGGALLILVSSFMFYVLWRKRRKAGIAIPSPLNSKRTKSSKIETTNHGMHVVIEMKPFKESAYKTMTVLNINIFNESQQGLFSSDSSQHIS